MPDDTTTHVLRAGSDWCSVDCPHPVHKEPLSIFGRERALMDGVAKRVLQETHKRYEATNLRETRRGSYFEVRVPGPDGTWDGHVARITVELDRMEKKHDDETLA